MKRCKNEEPLAMVSRDGLPSPRLPMGTRPLDLRPTPNRRQRFDFNVFAEKGVTMRAVPTGNAQFSYKVDRDLYIGGRTNLVRDGSETGPRYLIWQPIRFGSIWTVTIDYFRRSPSRVRRFDDGIKVECVIELSGSSQIKFRFIRTDRARDPMCS